MIAARLLLVLVLVLLLLLTLRLKAGHGNTVKVTHAVLADSATTLGVLLQNTDALETLDDLALHGAGSGAVVRRAETTVGSTTVELGKSTDTNSLAEVNVASNSGYWEEQILSSVAVRRWFIS